MEFATISTVDDGLRRNSTSARMRGRVRRPGGNPDLPGRPHAVPPPRPDPDHLERQQLQRAQRGDNRAFAELIRRHDPTLRMVVARLVSPEATDELLTTTYVKAYRALPVYRSDQPPRLWLCQLAVASCLDQLRRRQHRLRLSRRRGPIGSVAPPPPPTVPTPDVDDGRAPSAESGIRIIDEATEGNETTAVKAADDEHAPRDFDDNHRDINASPVTARQRDKSSDDVADRDVHDDQPDPATSGVAGAGQQPVDELDAMLAANALQSLLVEDRVAVVLVDGAAVAPNDAAAVVEVTPATLRTRLDRGRAQLRQQLGSPRGLKAMPRTSRRDGRDIAAWLDRLSVPAHDEEFWQVLGEELLTASDQPALPRPDPGHGGRLPVWVGPTTRLPGPSTTGTGPGADDRNVRGLAYRARQVGGGGRTFNLGRWVAGLAVVVLVLAVLGAGFLLANRASRKDASLGLTTSKVITKVDDALAADQSITGTVTVDSGGPPVVAGTYQFVRGADGSYKITSPSNGWSEAYDASNGRFSVTGNPANTGPVSLQATHLAPGLPDPTAASSAALGDPLDSILRLFDVGQNKALTQLGSNGLPQYVLDADLPPIGSGPYESTAAGHVPGVGSFARSGGADHIRILIDESLQLPTDVQLTRQQNSVMHLRFTGVSVGGAPPANTFDVSTGSGTAIDAGFQTIQLGQAPEAVGYQPLTPAYLPGGYVLTAVAARSSKAAGPQATAGGGNPPGAGVLVLTYRHGADEITVTTRRATSHPGTLWQDPFATAGTVGGHTVRIRAGHFLNVQAGVSDQPVRHVWGHDRRFVFTVAGDAPTTELVKVASSLH